MKKNFYLQPSNILPNEMIILRNDTIKTTIKSCFLSTVIKAKKINDSRFDEQYEWLKENHPEYLI